MPRLPITETQEIYMLRILKNGKWECDVGQYCDAEHIKETIAKRGEPPAGVEWLPIKQTITTVTEFLA